MEEVELSRDMGLFHITMIGIGAMIGAGIFVLTGIAAGIAGPGFILAFLLNGIIAGLTAMAYAELGSCMAEAGGGYVWIKRSLPNPLGFLSGWMDWFAHCIACSLYSLGFGAYFVILLEMAGVNFMGIDKGILIKVFAVIICAFFAYINFKGASQTGKAESVVTMIKIIILVMFIGFGVLAIIRNGDYTNFTPLFPKGFFAVFTAMGLTYIAFEGYEIIAQAGEEVVNPKKNIPRAIFISLLIVIPLYLLVGFVAIGATHIEGMETYLYLGQSGETAMVEAAKTFMPAGALILLIGGLMSTVSALNATIYSSSRVSFAMGRDHDLPEVFGRIHNRTRTPHISIFISATLIILMAILLPIEDVASAAGIFFLLIFIGVNIAMIRIRKQMPELDRGFITPLFPFIPLFAIIAQLFIAAYLFGYSPVAWYTAFFWIIIGVIAFYLYPVKKEREEIEAQIVYEEKEIEKRPYRILVPIANPETVKDLITLASIIAREKDGEILAMAVIKVPEQLPVSSGREFVDEKKPIIQDAVEACPDDIPINTLIRVGHSIPRAITETAKTRNCDLIILGWRGWTWRQERILGSTIDPVVIHAPCDVIIARFRDFVPEMVKTILVPTIGGVHANFAYEIAKIFERAGGRIRAVRIVKDLKEEKTHITEDEMDIELIRAPSVRAKLIELSKESDLLVIGATEEPIFKRLVFGIVPETVARSADCTVIMVKRYENKVVSILKRWLG
ncbi:MAG: cationic amino acid transporter [Candidatus Syntrophoarchaeum caldarius]|uniref:Cationic amino acid transporter n=1 Tax=Candidatus Syntropharchaeum caldarium TaxID=1838285 RepID=A0A1F2P9B3_9EURY|nr:MAG: cationic amino acid transporter [Candidatus Syntrophoarchaeum caldarius]